MKRHLRKRVAGSAYRRIGVLGKRVGVTACRRVGVDEGKIDSLSTKL
jgi:hypothetical protein